MSLQVLFVIALLFVHSVLGRKEVPIEHMYYDASQRFDAGELARSIRDGRTESGGTFLAVDSTALVPVALKLQCKAAGCPKSDRRPAMISGCAWENVNDRTLYIEETAGWLLLWLDEKHTIPLIPKVSPKSVDAYIKGANAGKLTLL